jgi:hypothetical protein
LKRERLDIPTSSHFAKRNAKRRRRGRCARVWHILEAGSARAPVETMAAIPTMTAVRKNPTIDRSAALNLHRGCGSQTCDPKGLSDQEERSKRRTSDLPSTALDRLVCGVVDLPNTLGRASSPTGSRETFWEVPVSGEVRAA